MRSISVLVAAVVALSGCAAQDPAGGDEEIPTPDPDTDPESAAGDKFFNETFQLTIGPSGTASADGMFPVELGALLVEAIWSTTSATAELSFSMSDPEGAQRVSASGASGEARKKNPNPGNWTWTMQAQRAVQAEIDLTIHVATDPMVTTRISGAEIVGPNTFFEINAIMDPNATMSWSWATAGGEDLAYNVHTHFDGGVQYVIEITTDSHEGGFMSERQGFHSPMWENPGQTPVTVDYRFWGAFEVDSYFPPR